MLNTVLSSKVHCPECRGYIVGIWKACLRCNGKGLIEPTTYPSETSYNNNNNNNTIPIKTT